MSSKNRNKIPTDGPQAPLGGLGDAFAGLELPGSLPEGPEEVAQPEPTWKMGRVVLRREKARRGGKTVIVVHDFASHLPDSILNDIARKLRASCGCGGTVRNRTVEIQGDQPGKVRKILEAEGFQVAGVK